MVVARYSGDYCMFPFGLYSQSRIQHKSKPKCAAISVEGEFLPWLLQQFPIAHPSYIAGIVTDHGAGHNCELGEEGRRQTERRYANDRMSLTLTPNSADQ